MTFIEFPAMREQVIAAIRALADPRHQATRWGVYEPGVDYYDDLTLNLHILYDDCRVLPGPDDAVGSLLLAQEVPALRALEERLGPLIDDLGDRPEADYLSDPRWQSVIEASKSVLAAMEEAECSVIHGLGRREHTEGEKRRRGSSR